MKEQEKEKPLFLEWKFLLTVGLTIFLLGYYTYILYNISPQKHEYAMTSSIIKSSDNILKMIEDEKYTEASYLADSITVKWNFLSQSYDRNFYEKIEEDTYYNWVTISADLEVFENCSAHSIEQRICDELERAMIRDIKKFQERLCEKSYFSKEMIKSEYGNREEEIVSQLLNQTKC